MKVLSSVTGAPDGPPVVLHNSLGCAQRMWDPQVGALTAAGVRVVRYDARGHGGSAVPPGPYSLADLGGDVLDLMADLGLTSAVHVGLSLGGMVAMWLAENAEETVAGLVLCATSAALGPSQAWRERAALVRRQGTAPMADVLLPRWLTPGFSAAHPDRVEWVREQILATPAEGFAGCCEAIASMDLVDGLGGIGVPTAVLVGRQDPGTPPDHAERIASALPDATLTVLDPGGHLLNVERPEPVTSAILDCVARIPAR